MKDMGMLKKRFINKPSIMINTAEEFYKLRTSSDQKEYSRAASDKASLQVWLEIIKIYPDMRFWVAQNKTVPVEILEILAKDKNPKVRWMVASKRKLPEKLQLLLAKDSEILVRKRLIYNKKTTIKTLRMLLEDPEEKIKEAAKGQIKTNKNFS